MIFKILKKSFKSKARLGVIETKHGVIETPCFVPVATNGTIKALSSEDVLKTNTQLLICNAFHLHLRAGDKNIKKLSGLHKFMNWEKPLMTDSGGFQVFSLGSDKNYSPERAPVTKVNEDGIFFRSYVDGKALFMGPKESIKIQEALGADIIFAFDECTTPGADYKQVKRATERTHKWAIQCIETHNQQSITRNKNSQALYGIFQGGKFKDLRKESIAFINSLPFDGFGIGGDFGSERKSIFELLRFSMENLPEDKPRHLLGIGHVVRGLSDLTDVVDVVKTGVDTFDSSAPTLYARHGIAYTAKGKINMAKIKLLKDKNPIDKNCSCYVCANYSRAYISHLLRAKEMSAMQFLTFHNLHFFNAYVNQLRQLIKQGKL